MSTQDDYIPGMSLADDWTKSGRVSSQPVSMIEVMKPSPHIRNGHARHRAAEALGIEPKVKKPKRPPRNPDHPKAVEAREMAEAVRVNNEEKRALERKIRMAENNTYQEKVKLFRQKGIHFVGTGHVTIAYKVLSSTRASVAIAIKSPKDPNRPLLAQVVAGQRMYDGLGVVEVPIIKSVPPGISMLGFARTLSEVVEHNQL